jgi:hypothetical protein
MRYTFSIIFFLAFFSFSSFSQDSTAVDTTKRIFEKVDNQITIAGGEQAWRRFLERNLNILTAVENGAPSGKYTVIVQFVVDTNGSISNIKPLTNEGYGMEEEVVRVLKKSGFWTPGFKDGKPVKAYRKQPVTFMVMEDGFNIFTRTPYVLYTDIENELTIKADNIREENLEIEISDGIIAKNEDGKFIALIKKPGRIVITVYNKRKKNKAIGAMSFEVRQSSSSTSDSK